MSELNRATILGTGTMGPGMGAVLARAGLQVTMFDVDPGALARTEGMVAIVNGVLDRLEVPVRDGGAIRYESEQANALADAEIVLEAVPEKLELKQQLLAPRRVRSREQGTLEVWHGTPAVVAVRLGVACEPEGFGAADAARRARVGGFRLDDHLTPQLLRLARPPLALGACRVLGEVARLIQ